MKTVRIIGLALITLLSAHCAQAKGVEKQIKKSPKHTLNFCHMFRIKNNISFSPTRIYGSRLPPTLYKLRRTSVHARPARRSLGEVGTSLRTEYIKLVPISIFIIFSCNTLPSTF